MPTKHRGRSAKNSNIFARLTRLRITTAPVSSTPWTWNTDFAISRPIVLTSPMDGSPQSGLLQRNHPMALRCRRVGAVHSIKNGSQAARMTYPVYSQNQTSSRAACPPLWARIGRRDSSIQDSGQRLSDPHNRFTARFRDHRRAVSRCVRGRLGKVRAGLIRSRRPTPGRQPTRQRRAKCQAPCELRNGRRDHGHHRCERQRKDRNDRCCQQLGIAVTAQRQNP
jgi:hypothetical protein